jgi:cytochrome c553
MKIARENKLNIEQSNNRRIKAARIFIFVSGIIAFLALNACRQNSAVSQTNETIPNRQNSQSTNENKAAQANINSSPEIVEKLEPPKIYRATCAECHGDNGEGTKKHPELKGVATREEDPLSDEDLLAIINDAKSQGLSAKMPSFKNKLTEEEKRQIISWLKTLK